MRTRLKTMCDDTHTGWPARSRHARHTDRPEHRLRAYGADVDQLTQDLLQRHRADLTIRPTLHLVDGIDPTTGEIR